MSEGNDLAKQLLNISSMLSEIDMARMTQDDRKKINIHIKALRSFVARRKAAIGIVTEFIKDQIVELPPGNIHSVTFADLREAFSRWRKYQQHGKVNARRFKAIFETFGYGRSGNKSRPIYHGIKLKGKGSEEVSTIITTTTEYQQADNVRYEDGKPDDADSPQPVIVTKSKIISQGNPVYTSKNSQIVKPGNAVDQKRDSQTIHMIVPNHLRNQYGDSIIQHIHGSL